MHHHKGFSAMLQVDVSTFVDARGRTKQFLATRCPGPECKAKQCMILALRGLEPAHMTGDQALELIELLRAGPHASALRPSPVQSGRMFVVKDLGGARYVLGYDMEGRCDFLIAGGPVDNVPSGMSTLLSAEHRLKLAGVIERELAVNTGDLTGRAAAQA